MRYTKESLGEDLTFRAAKPIVGGREIRGANGELEHGAVASSFNNFQARYAIRHPWTGPVGALQRGNADLATFAKANIPEIGFVAAPGMAAAADAPIANPAATGDA